ncbi:hypothetical protein PECL_248 [Pediococcus claussenii ATCC BAA-344]|uniref:Uncharacterized protein n=1 Tax=Pediococcus claussenii (strain ATCC BAA-344 / DSM 14800 / JCM 18046 / KCTC 3811 / LMG 21948 / P06) TaxID=701521 RepID=G8PAD2_PEDCP|nr:hypothetical protein PECL_248 [Pediococcus claussenii ATCC BAA-344]
MFVSTSDSGIALISMSYSKIEKSSTFGYKKVSKGIKQLNRIIRRSYKSIFV